MKTRNDLVVGGAVTGNRQGKYQCEAAKILRRIADELTQQCQGTSYFGHALADAAKAYKLMVCAKHEQWKSFERFVGGILKPKRRKAKKGTR
jgi:hypothetical protein